MSENQRTLGIFLMGGTVDSRNDPNLDGTVTPLRISLVRQYLHSLQLQIQMVLREICLKDSRNITQKDREHLCQSIEEINSPHNIVTHGTYSVRETARFLFSKGIGRDKTTILTGSMSPLQGSTDDFGRLCPSDGGFNLGYAISEAFHNEPGVYQAMNGALFKQPHEEWWHDSAGIHWTGKDDSPDGETTKTTAINLYRMIMKNAGEKKPDPRFGWQKILLALLEQHLQHPGTFLSFQELASTTGLSLFSIPGYKTGIQNNYLKFSNFILVTSRQGWMLQEQAH